MTYLNLPEINHEDYKYDKNEFQNFIKPLIIRGGCKDTEAYKKWNFNYIVNKNKNLSITKFLSMDDMQKSFPLYKDKYIESDELEKLLFKNDPPFYYTANSFLENDSILIKDIENISEKYRKPHFLEYSGYSFFMGYETYTNSHLHVFHDFLVNVVRGTKIFYIWNLFDNLFLLKEHYHGYHYNNKNFWERDHNKMKIYRVVLNEGDSLILPPDWFHAVYTPGFSIMIAKVYEKNNGIMKYFSNNNSDFTFILPILFKFYDYDNRYNKILKNKKSKTKYYYFIFLFIILVSFMILKNKYKG